MSLLGHYLGKEEKKIGYRLITFDSEQFLIFKLYFYYTRCACLSIFSKGQII